MTAAEASIEDDSAYAKVPEDEIPPIKKEAQDATNLAAHADKGAQKVTGVDSPALTAPTASQPRQIPGLAFRAASQNLPNAKKSSSEKE